MTERKTYTVALLAGLVMICSEAGAFTLRQVPNLEGYASAAEAAKPDDTVFLAQDAARTPGTKSTWSAVWRSLVLPGWGEQYLGSESSAKVFYIAEGTIWASFVIFEAQGYLRQQDYEDYAMTFAGVTTTDHSDDYYGLLTQYDTFIGYEMDIKSEGRAELYPDADAETIEQYWLTNRVPDYEPWIWQSVEDRRAYQETRSSSKRSYRRGTYAIAFAIANRVAASIFAVKIARDQQHDAQTSFHLEFGPPRYQPGAGAQTGASIVRRF